MKDAFSIADLKPTSESYKVGCTILNISSVGNADTKMPIRMIAKIEHSGETINLVSWAYDALPVFNQALKSINVYDLELQVTMYNSQPSYRAKSAVDTGTESTRKVLDIVDDKAIKKEISRILNEYVHTPELKTLVEISLSDSRFWTHPAAKSVHHAYKFGLSQHTMETLQNVEYLAKTYSNFNLEVAIVGATLHDVGKIYEYADDGNFTLDGYLTSHIPLGIVALTENMIKASIDPKSTLGLTLVSIIASHHGKTEYGSNTTPTTLEATVVSLADSMSATMRSAISALAQLEPGSRTDHLIGVFDGAQLVKLDDSILFKNNVENN